MELGDTFIPVYEDIELGYHNQYSYRLGNTVSKSQQVREIFLFSRKEPRPSLGPAPASNSMGTGFFSRGQVASECEFDCSSQFSTIVELHIYSPCMPSWHAQGQF